MAGSKKITRYQVSTFPSRYFLGRHYHKHQHFVQPNCWRSNWIASTHPRQLRTVEKLTKGLPWPKVAVLPNSARSLLSRSNSRTGYPKLLSAGEIKNSHAPMTGPPRTRLGRRDAMPSSSSSRTLTFASLSTANWFAARNCRWCKTISVFRKCVCSTLTPSDTVLCSSASSTAVAGSFPSSSRSRDT